MINFPSTNSKVSMFISTYISGGKIVWRQGSTVTISVGATIAFTNDNLAGSFIIISDGVQIPNPQGNLIVKMTVGSKSILAGPVLYTAKAMV